jgi:hypothetical protein
MYDIPQKDSEDGLEETATVATGVGSVKRIDEIGGNHADRRKYIKQWLERMGPYGGM